MCSSWPSPAPPGKSTRSTPAAPPSPVPLTEAGLPSCSSTQRRISSWSVVVFVWFWVIAHPIVLYGFMVMRLHPLNATVARSGLPDPGLDVHDLGQRELAEQLRAVAEAAAADAARLRRAARRATPDG